MQTKIKVMLFADKIRQLREDNQMLQRQIASALEIDTPMYSKIERGDRPAKREQVVLIAKLLNTAEDKLLALWLADKVLEIINNEKDLSVKVLEIVKNNIK